MNRLLGKVHWCPKELEPYMIYESLVLTDDEKLYHKAQDQGIAVAFVGKMEVLNQAPSVESSSVESSSVEPSSAEAASTNRAPSSCRFVVQANNLDELEDEDLERIFRRCKGIPWEILETARTNIREFTLSDLDSLFDLYDKDGVTKYMEGLFDYEKELEYQKQYIQYIYEFYGYGMWLIFDKFTNQLIGRAGIESRDTCKVGQLELGYVIAPEYQCMGYATEVCTAIIDYAFSEVGASSIITRINPLNLPSLKLAEKLGFTYEKALENGENQYLLEK